MEKSKRHNKCRNDLVAGATQVSSRKRDNLTVAGVADRMARKSKRHNKMENEESTYINDIAYMGNRETGARTAIGVAERRTEKSKRHNKCRNNLVAEATQVSSRYNRDINRKRSGGSNGEEIKTPFFQMKSKGY